MLPKANRLTKKKDFDLVFKNGQSLKKDFLICKVLKNQLQESRFGFVVSKKISNKATIRNAVKRRLRKAVLDELAHIKKAADVVIITLPGAQNREFAQVKKTAGEILKKAGLI